VSVKDVHNFLSLLSVASIVKKNEYGHQLSLNKLAQLAVHGKEIV